MASIHSPKNKFRVVQENQQAYPSFNWQTVKKYKI